MSEHKDFCGSRTEKCEKCKKFVKLRDQILHEHNGCQERSLGQNGKNPYKQPLTYTRGPEQTSLWPGNHVVDFFPEDVPFHHEPYYRQTVMEELDSNSMIGQRRSLKNETTQRHNQKNERTVQNLYCPPTDGKYILTPVLFSHPSVGVSIVGLSVYMAKTGMRPFFQMC